MLDNPNGNTEGKHNRRSFELREHTPGGLNEFAFIYYRRLQRVKDHVEQNVQEPLTLESLANVAGLEKTYFSKYFRRRTGITVTEWLNWVRVQHSVGLMRNSNLTITDIAYTVGFNDLRTFERATNRFIGLCPMKLKQLIGPMMMKVNGALYVAADWLEPVVPSLLL